LRDPNPAQHNIFFNPSNFKAHEAASSLSTYLE